MHDIRDEDSTCCPHVRNWYVYLKWVYVLVVSRLVYTRASCAYVGSVNLLLAVQYECVASRCEMTPVLAPLAVHYLIVLEGGSQQILVTCQYHLLLRLEPPFDHAFRRVENGKRNVRLVSRRFADREFGGLFKREDILAEEVVSPDELLVHLRRGDDGADVR